MVLNGLLVSQRLPTIDMKNPVDSLTKVHLCSIRQYFSFDHVAFFNPVTSPLSPDCQQSNQAVHHLEAGFVSSCQRSEGDALKDLREAGETNFYYGPNLGG